MCRASLDPLVYYVFNFNRFDECCLLQNKDIYICCGRFRSSKKSQCVQEMGAARKRIFGVPPVVLLQKLGVPLPPAVTLAMQHLKAVARNSTGLFRKPGVQSRIQQLQNELENNIGKKLIFCSFTSWQYICNNWL